MSMIFISLLHFSFRGLMFVPQISKRLLDCGEYEKQIGQNLEGFVEFQQWGNNIPVSISFGALAKNSEQRRDIVKGLVKNGVETRIYSAGNLGRHPFWTAQYGQFEDTMSDKIHKNGFFLPNYPELTDEEIDLICEVVKSNL